MNKVLKNLIDPYKCKTLEEEIRALKEVIQEIALLGLWRSKFYEKGAFYGGTALRILYGLNRFSEDLDFTLLNTNKDFDITSYEDAILRELESFGLEARLERKIKDGEIETAFIKGNTLIHLIKIGSPFRVHNKQQIKVKIEVDKDPPLGFDVEVKQHFSPIPFSIKSLSLPDLFAGKLHACLCRSERINIKGRDWYDFLWYISRKTPVSLSHLHKRMEQSGNWDKKNILHIEDLKKLLIEKIKKLDLERAKKDVAPFIKNVSDLDAWSTEAFIEATGRIMELKGGKS